MAKSATIYKVDLQVSDLDRAYYQSHRLTLAQHPSETKLRMILRVLVFALNASERLEFTKGLSTDEEPDLWCKSLSGEIDLWIELGQPSLKRIKKACGQASRVKIYTFTGRGAEIWWKQIEKDCARFKHLERIDLPAEQINNIENCISRSMSLHCTVQDSAVWFGDEHSSFEIVPRSCLGD